MNKYLILVILSIFASLNLLFFISVVERFDALEEKFCIHYDVKHSMYIDN